MSILLKSREILAFFKFFEELALAAGEVLGNVNNQADVLVAAAAAAQNRHTLAAQTDKGS